MPTPGHRCATRSNQTAVKPASPFPNPVKNVFPDRPSLTQAGTRDPSSERTILPKHSENLSGVCLYLSYPPVYDRRMILTNERTHAVKKWPATGCPIFLRSPGRTSHTVNNHSTCCPCRPYRSIQSIPSPLRLFIDSQRFSSFFTDFHSKNHTNPLNLNTL